MSICHLLDSGHKISCGCRAFGGPGRDSWVVSRQREVNESNAVEGVVGPTEISLSYCTVESNVPPCSLRIPYGTVTLSFLSVYLPLFMRANASPLIRVPIEVLERVAFEVALSPALGPPVHIIPFLCTCKFIHRTISHAFSNDLYAKIFRAKFDVDAARRRFGTGAIRSRFLASQLKTYCVALKRIRRGDIDAPDIEALLRTVFILLTENDGKNREQLEWANAYQFVNNFVHRRLWQDTINGWPKDTPLHSLVLWVFWCLTDASTFFCAIFPPSPPFLLMILQTDSHSKLRTSGTTSLSLYSLTLSCPLRSAFFASYFISLFSYVLQYPSFFAPD